MKEAQYTQLLNKFVEGTTTEEENQLLFTYYPLVEPDNEGWDESVLGDQEKTGASLLTKVYDEIDSRERKQLLGSYRRFWSVAAAIIIIGFSLFYFKSVPVVQQDLAIKPGGNRATLVLDNGERINLSDQNSEEIAKAAGISIIKDGTGKLVYKINESTTALSNQPTTYHTIETPRGGEYQVILPDGTHVWLNAESSLQFPTRFNAPVREVNLTGEAYFEVAKNKSLPFIVSTSQQQISVLGTHFNVNAYRDESEVKTTLLEGAVRVEPTNSRFLPKLLKPGEQAVLGAQRWLVNEVDVEEAISWKNGFFLFNNEDIKTAMRKLARWYNVEVSFQGEFNNIQFGGSFSKNNSLQETLHILESTNKFKCKIEGRRMIIIR